MDLSQNEWGPGKDVLKLEAWGFYLFIYLCPALFKKDLRRLMKIHKVEQRRINGEAKEKGAALWRTLPGVRRPQRGPGHTQRLSFSNFCQGTSCLQGGSPSWCRESQCVTARVPRTRVRAHTHTLHTPHADGELPPSAEAPARVERLGTGSPTHLASSPSSPPAGRLVWTQGFGHEPRRRRTSSCCTPRGPTGKGTVGHVPTHPAFQGGSGIKDPRLTLAVCSQPAFHSPSKLQQWVE